MTGWRLETAIATVMLAAVLMFAAAGVPPTIEAILYWIAALLAAGGLVCANRAWIGARARRGRKSLLLAIAAALLLGSGLAIAGSMLAEPADLNNGHPL